MQKIAPFLWFDNQAEEAINFYTSVFENSKIVRIQRYPDEPVADFMQGLEGKVLTAEFELAGHRFMALDGGPHFFMALDGGPHFNFTPAVSFFVNCQTEAEVDARWEQLSEGGSVMMPLQEYPFSKKYGWLADKYGVSWQVILSPDSDQKIVPCLLFVGEQNGKAEEAMQYYTALFEEAGIDEIARHDEGSGGDPGTVAYAAFRLNGQPFAAMDGGLDHDFTFTEAISLHVECASQEEVDHFWQMSAVPEAEQCGWLKDQYGVSWQIIPTALIEGLNDPDPEKAERVMQAMLPMKKIDIAGLQATPTS